MSRLAASLLLILLITVHASAVEFLEAPFFHNSHECKDKTINIAMTLDDAYLRGSLAAVLSIVHHADCPENLRFHFIYSTKNLQDRKYLTTTITASFPYLHFAMHAFDEETVTGLISTSLRQALDRPLNYARSYLARLLPESVRRVIYLDSDVILVDDIEKLWETEFADNNSVIAAPEYCNDADMTRYFTPTFWANLALASVFTRRRSRACYFNTGVMVVDVGGWREREYTKEIEEWMELQKRMRIYELGSLPPFLLVFAGDVTAVARRWNQHGLGGDNYEGHCRGLHAGESSLLHWSGRDKPWVRLDEGRACPVDALWEPYDMLRKPLRFLHVDDH